MRSNANKIVLDPYARAIGRDVRWANELFGYKIGDPARTSPSMSATALPSRRSGWCSTRPSLAGVPQSDQ